MQKYYGWGLPFNASADGAEMDRLLYLIHIFMAVLFVGWLIFLVTAIIRFRQRPGRAAEYHARHFKAPTYVEVGVAVLEILLLVGFSFPIVYKSRHSISAQESMMRIRVVAEQFAWNVHYSGKDGIFGRADVKWMSAMNPLGLDPEDPRGRDDITSINQLHLPVNRAVEVLLSSKDVIHSFFIPVMRVKQDMIPGQVIPVWFRAVHTGNFEIACAQLCGLGHYRMRGYFMVESESEFQSWLDKMAPVPPVPVPQTPSVSVSQPVAPVGAGGTTL